MKRRTKIGIVVFSAIIVLLSSLSIQILVFPKINYDGTADCAIILGAAVDTGQPSAVFQARLDHGIDLYQQRIVKKLILTGGIGDGDTLSEGEVGATYVHGKRIPTSATLVERTSKTTLQNLREAKKLMDDNGLATAIIISDPLQLRRSAITADWLQMNAGSAATPYTKYKSWKTKIPFLLRELYFTIQFKLFRQSQRS